MNPLNTHTHTHPHWIQPYNTILKIIPELKLEITRKHNCYSYDDTKKHFTFTKNQTNK